MGSANGFTLVELLVVIAILAIFATIGTVYYVGINAKVRDSARMANLYTISTALEVNKRPDTYKPLLQSQFSSFQWLDPIGDVYCIATGTPLDPVNTSPWGSTCPVGFGAVAPGEPSSNFTTWKVCTFLENPEPPLTNVFCKTHRQ